DRQCPLEMRVPPRDAGRSGAPCHRPPDHSGVKGELTELRRELAELRAGQRVEVAGLQQQVVEERRRGLMKAASVAAAMAAAMAADGN
ncbi:MAG: hypothetical protein M1829_003346, partial [Trizodia sp. TS-e1964]